MNGFFEISWDKRGYCGQLLMEPRIYYSPSSNMGRLSDGAMLPIKAKEEGDTYIIRRMSASEFPNLYATTDFKEFHLLTEYSPQKDYNWYTTEAVRWKLPNGQDCDGILFKPQRTLISKNRYPIIFYYYETSSDALNTFVDPQWSGGWLNISWYVSNGYLVFIPDIPYSPGHPGKSAEDAVVSAARFLSQKAFVDAKHMGLQGHSLGALRN